MSVWDGALLDGQCFSRLGKWEGEVLRIPAFDSSSLENLLKCEVLDPTIDLCVFLAPLQLISGWVRDTLSEILLEDFQKSSLFPSFQRSFPVNDPQIISQDTRLWEIPKT